MARRIADAALQYSKRLSKFISWSWVIYRFSVLIASAIVPSAAEALVSTISGIDTIMLVNEGTYLVNSLGEKYIYSDKFALAFLKKGGFLQSVINKKAEEEETEEEESEDGNG